MGAKAPCYVHETFKYHHCFYDSINKISFTKQNSCLIAWNTSFHPRGASWCRGSHLKPLWAKWVCTHTPQQVATYVCTKKLYRQLSYSSISRLIDTACLHADSHNLLWFLPEQSSGSCPVTLKGGGEWCLLLVLPWISRVSLGKSLNPGVLRVNKESTLLRVLWDLWIKSTLGTRHYL